jgi:alanyl-tRNA synthetase
MTLNEIRSKYLEFFKARGHTIIPSASLVPENDPTTLFTGSGMQPLLPYLLGAPHPQGSRLVDSQKSFRSMDIEEVGDNRHTTFFEMLGNWSLGDYFKKEQLPWFFEFLTDVVGLDPQHLYVTAFIGDAQNKLPKDDESAQIWQTLFENKGIEAKVVEIGSEANGYTVGMQGGRIFYYDAKKNWWSRAGSPENMPVGEPGGPDSEVFYDFGTPHDPTFGKECHPNCDCGRFLEIGNSVFMQYQKQADGSFTLLPKQNVDFGGGLERIAAASLGSPDVFEIDTFKELIRSLETLSGSSYQDTSKKRSFRIVADHVRAAMFLIGDDVLPSNTDQGYFVRRLIRRAVQHADRLGVTEGALAELIKPMAKLYEAEYPALKDAEAIAVVVREEDARFRKTLTLGMREFEKMAKKDISGADAFLLFSSYGFPVEMTLELASERGISVDQNGFKEEMKKHQDLSRAGSEQKFKGGMADHGEMSVKYHTATHLLHKALRDVLGADVFQKGSNITPERLRFDFSFGRKMTEEEKKRVEDIINARIADALPVTYEDLPIEEAEKRGAIGLFEEKYGDKVRVYKIGDFSMEFCGGPHVNNTSDLREGGKRFKIVKEEAVSAGVRRIKAVLE